MDIKDFNILYNEYIDTDLAISEDYTNRINKHFMAYLKNTNDKQADTFKTLTEALIIAMLADLFKKWNKQLKNISKNAYDFSKEQTKGLKVVKKDITKDVIENLYKTKLDSAIADLTYVTQNINANANRIIEDIETNLEQSKKQISLDLMEEYSRYGITYFTKTDGARMGINDYIKIKSADLAISTFRNVYFADMLSKGIELVQVKRLPTDAIECQNCVAYDEKVLSLQEKEGYESVATAKMNNLFHFNCFHYVIPFMGEPTDEERTIVHTDENKKSYERNVKKGIKRKLID